MFGAESGIPGPTNGSTRENISEQNIVCWLSHLKVCTENTLKNAYSFGKTNPDANSNIWMVSKHISGPTTVSMSENSRQKENFCKGNPETTC